MEKRNEIFAKNHARDFGKMFRSNAVMEKIFGFAFQPREGWPRAVCGECVCTKSVDQMKSQCSGSAFPVSALARAIDRTPLSWRSPRCDYRAKLGGGGWKCSSALPFLQWCYVVCLQKKRNNCQMRRRHVRPMEIRNFKYPVVPWCSVTFWTHPEIIPVEQFFPRWIKSINQAYTFIVNLSIDWLIDWR